MKVGAEMSIRYASNIEFITKEALQELFLSVNWESGKYPNELLQAIQSSHSIVAAWDGDRLIGLVNALSDGVLTVYFHYMLIDPSYQGKGVGKKMMTTMLNRYKEYKNKVLISYPSAVDFYYKCGFSSEHGATPMFISELV
ncbi:GNAT family acetyltransferase [Paenibacillus sp. FSL R7-277]|uniref:GNAT family N-acetyltransferase n=1 Tax=Paenibacillus sp. FSL R7-277 TaxID=1227352 RepID=UPI0003E28043|nr:GNAT family N-acetyltransferase [Paenibacillus sp. FSL R7-277]ETT58544.1 GNAT family acetyltransferase [Paenibacillus sp. FSL R7-277]